MRISMERPLDIIDDFLDGDAKAEATEEYDCTDTTQGVHQSVSFQDKNVNCKADQVCELLETPCAPGTFPCDPQPVCIGEHILRLHGRYDAKKQAPLVCFA